MRYGETDAMGVVYYANYFTYFEVGRTDFFHALGAAYAAVEARGFLAPCVEATCRYLAPARYDQELLLTTRLVGLPGVRLVFAYTLASADGGQVLARGRTVHACVNRAGRPLSLRKHWPELWARLCAWLDGEPA